MKLQTQTFISFFNMLQLVRSKYFKVVESTIKVPKTIRVATNKKLKSCKYTFLHINCNTCHDIYKIQIFIKNSNGAS